MNIKKLNEELQKYLSINEISDETIRKVARKRYLDAKINTELYDNTNKSPIFRDAAEKSELKWDRLQDRLKRRPEVIGNIRNKYRNEYKNDEIFKEFFDFFRSLTDDYPLNALVQNTKQIAHKNNLELKFSQSTQPTVLDIAIFCYDNRLNILDRSDFYYIQQYDDIKPFFENWLKSNGFDMFIPLEEDYKKWEEWWYYQTHETDEDDL